MEAGSKIPADCVLLEGQDFVCNEGRYHNVEVEEVEKQPMTLGECKDCFLLQDSLVTKGHGKALVCAVGERTR